MAAALTPEFIAMIDRGVSAIVASRGLDLRPSVMRAVGSSIAPGTGRITVFVGRTQSRQLIQDLAATGAIAVVFSEPSSHRTVQLKASRVTVRNAAAADVPALARYLASMEQEIARVGFAPPFTRAMLAHDLADTVAIEFAPEQAFDQTPGPAAGRSLQGSAP